MNPLRTASTLIALAGLLLVARPSLAVSQVEPQSTYTLIFENDLFYQTDRDYTNGVEASWSPPEQGAQFIPASTMAPLLSLFDLRDIRASLSLGQLMFTPEHVALVNPPTGERPYAGFLYGGISLSEATDVGQKQLRVQLGMVGPASLAADSQKLIHGLRGFDFPRGWNTQLRDEPGLVIAYQESQAIGSLSGKNGLGMDVRSHFGATVGNIFDYLSAGIMARAGLNTPNDDGPPRIQPAALSSFQYEPNGHFGAYLFAGGEARLIGRNLFLDGNSFQSSRSVSKKAIVGDLVVGAAVTVENFRLSFAHTFRSREYAQQDQFDQFGTLSISMNLG